MGGDGPGVFEGPSIADFPSLTTRTNLLFHNSHL